MYQLSLNGTFNLKKGDFLRKVIYVFLLICVTGLPSADAQHSDPIAAIRELKESYLLVRFPAYKAKIDTLNNMINRTKDQNTLKRLQYLLSEAIEERDTLHAEYKRAFLHHYNFSKVAYYFDHEARDLGKAHFYKMDGSGLSWDEINDEPYYLIFFERTKESKIDAMVIYHRNGEKLPRPFPNDFTRSGFNFLFVKLSEKPFSDWRVSKINKRLHRFWEDVN